MAWLDPQPGPSGCQCPECYGLAEAMIEITGNAHGLPIARGHVSLREARRLKAEREARELPALGEPPRVRRPAAPQPWEPRPARNRAA